MAPLPSEYYQVVDAKSGELLRHACITVVDALGVSFRHFTKGKPCRWESLPLSKIADGPCVVHFTAREADTTSQTLLKVGARHRGTICGDYATEVVQLNSSALSKGQLRVSLRWGAPACTNKDLDLHCLTASGVHCHVGDKAPREDLSLDVDASGQQKGPETISIALVPSDTYYFYAHNKDLADNGKWALRKDLAESNATITLLSWDKTPRTFSVPTHPLRMKYWNAFTVTTDKSGAYKIRELNELVPRPASFDGGARQDDDEA